MSTNSGNDDSRTYPSRRVSLDQLSSPEHRLLYEYWLSRKPDSGLPSRRDFDPVDVPRLLPRIALIAVEPGTDRCRYRYRLAGTEIVRRAGRDPTGKTFEELYSGDYLKSANALYDELRRTGEPHLSQRVYPISCRDSYLRYDRLILPLASDHVRVDQFLLLIAVVEQVGTQPSGGSF